MSYVNPAAIELCEGCGEAFPDALSYDEHDCSVEVIEDFLACDATLATCSRAEPCCGDCTHTGNWAPEASDSEVIS